MDDIIILDSDHGHQFDIIAVMPEIIELERLSKGKLPRSDSHLIY